MKSVDELVKCMERELVMRRNVYARRVAEGKMPAFAAEHEIDCVKQIIEILKEKAEPKLL